MKTLEQYAELLHDMYEIAAKRNSWETQERSRKPWADVPDENKATMVEAVAMLLQEYRVDLLDDLPPDLGLAVTGVRLHEAIYYTGMTDLAEPVKSAYADLQQVLRRTTGSTFAASGARLEAKLAQTESAS